MTRRAGSGAGYTLLEMVVVMAVMALATAMVAPAGYRMLQSWREASEVEAVISQLRALPAQARTMGSTLELGSDAKTPADARPSSGAAATRPGGVLELPAGWRLRLHSPLRVHANGACADDAEATLETAHQQIGLRIEAPFCDVQRLDPGAG